MLPSHGTTAGSVSTLNRCCPDFWSMYLVFLISLSLVTKSGLMFRFCKFLRTLEDIPGNEYSLVNYIAIQKNIGYTISQQATQATLATPAQFNNKYYGPALTAYFHLNDLRALDALENGSQGYISSAAPNYTQCMKNLVSIKNNPLDIITNYAYNQGYFGGLVGASTTDCINSTPTDLLAKYNGYANAAGSSYNQYPYQVRFYLDELYNQSTLVPATNNHVAFSMTNLGNVFSSV